MPGCKTHKCVDAEGSEFGSRALCLNYLTVITLRGFWTALYRGVLSPGFWSECASAFFAVSQHPLCPSKFRDGESRKHPALQPVAPADEDLRERPPTATTSAVPTSGWPQESMIKKGSSSKTEKLFMDCLFSYKKPFRCTKFIDVRFYYILPSEKTNLKINFCVLQHRCLLASSSKLTPCFVCLNVCGVSASPLLT